MNEIPFETFPANERAKISLLNKYSVAIVGCGSIGALKADEHDRPGGDAVLTHAHAFSRHPQTELSYLIDNNVSKHHDAVLKWNPKWASNAIINDSPDIIVIATPTSSHYTILSNLLSVPIQKPKLVVAEKPFCSNLKEAQEIQYRYTAAGIPILVNYIRRFDAVTDQHLAAVKAGDYGRVFAARCLYGRGLRRDGCHGLDIFNRVFGRPIGLRIEHAGRIDDGADGGDSSFNLSLEYEACSAVRMVATDSRAWGAFELEFITEKGILSFVDWGKTIVFRTVDAEETFGQYAALGWPAKLVEKTGLTTAMLHMADNCVRYLNYSQYGPDYSPVVELACTSADAINVHRILEQVRVI